MITIRPVLDSSSKTAVETLGGPDRSDPKAMLSMKVFALSARTFESSRAAARSRAALRPAATRMFPSSPARLRSISSWMAARYSASASRSCVPSHHAWMPNASRIDTMMARPSATMRGHGMVRLRGLASRMGNAF